MNVSRIVYVFLIGLSLSGVCRADSCYVKYDFEQTGTDILPDGFFLTHSPDLLIDGKQSLQVVLSGNLTEPTELYRFPTEMIRPGGRYEISCDFRRPVDETDTGVFCLKIDCQQGWATWPKALLLRNNTVHDKSADVVALSYQVIVAGGTTDNRLALYGSGTGSIILDNVTIRRLDRLSPDQLYNETLLASAPVADKDKYTPYGMTHHVDWAPELSEPPDYGTYDEQEVERAVSMWKEMGVQWIRISMDWSRVFPSDANQPCSQYLARCEQIMSLCDAAGIQYYLQLGATPRWASANPEVDDFWAYAETDPADWDKYIRYIVERYGERIGYYEIGNEADWHFWHSSDEAYVSRLIRASCLIRELDPSAKILNGGLSSDGIYGSENDASRYNHLQMLFDLGAGPYIDIFNQHLYTATIEEAIYRVNRFYRVMLKNGAGDKPIWITETGYSTFGTRTDEDQAEYLKGLWSTLLTHPKVEKVFLYNFRCKGTDQSAMEDRFGLIERDWTPRPAYIALRDLPKRTKRMINPAFLTIDFPEISPESLFAPHTAEQVELSLHAGMPPVDEHRIFPLDTGTYEKDEAFLKNGLSLIPEKPFEWTFRPGDSVSVRAQTDIETAEPGDYAVLSVWDWHNHPVFSEKLSLPVNRPVTFNMQGRGVWLLTLDYISKNSELVSRLAKSFSALPDLSGKKKFWSMESPFFLGTCLFPGHISWTNAFGPMHPAGMTPEEAVRKELSLSSEAGLSMARIDAAGLSFDNPGLPSDGVYNFDWIDRQIDLLASYGMKPVLQINPLGFMVDSRCLEQGIPSWKCPPQMSLFEPFAEQYVQHLGQKASFIEVGNEPDNFHFWRGTTAEYLQMVRAVQQAAGKCRSVVPVVAGGLTPLTATGVEWEPLDVKTRKNAEIVRGMVETPFMTYHAHGDVLYMEELVRDTQKMCAEAGHPDMPMAQTEGGGCAWRLDLERLQAVMTLQKMYFAWANQGRGFLLYATRFQGGPRLQWPDKIGGTPSGWGFVDYFFCPRFAYGAVNAFADRMAGAQFVRIWVQSDDLHIFEFKRNNQPALAVYTPCTVQNVYTEKDIQIQCAGRNPVVEMYDPMGNLSDTVSGKEIEVKATAYPQLLIFREGFPAGWSESK